MTPRHLIPIEPRKAVENVCQDIALQLPNMHSVTWLELLAFRETRTPHDARRLINALRHIAKRDDLARKVEVLLLDTPKTGVVVQLNQGERSQ